MVDVLLSGDAMPRVFFVAATKTVFCAIFVF
jgi:hypothetical protein